MHKTLIQYQIDAFAQKPFTGNPAAVIRLKAFLGDALMQAIAEENNLSETAFVVPKNEAGYYDLRWFTPSAEIDFCGHATIATAHALSAEFKDKQHESGGYVFETKVGRLSVTLSKSRYSLSAPAARPALTPLTPAIHKAFPMQLKAAFLASNNIYVVAENPDDVESYKPLINDIIALSNHGVGLTAEGGNGRAKTADFTSRFFVPAMGIEEDPVTGSAHAALAPYWANRLDKVSLQAFQASARGGWLELDVSQDRVVITGPAITFAKSEIYLKGEDI